MYETKNHIRRLFVDNVSLPSQQSQPFQRHERTPACSEDAEPLHGGGGSPPTAEQRMSTQARPGTDTNNNHQLYCRRRCRPRSQPPAPPSPPLPSVELIAGGIARRRR